MLAEESSGLEELNEAIPDEIVFPLLNTTWKQTMAAGAEVAKRDAISLMELPSRRNENKQLLFGYLD